MWASAVTRSTGERIAWPLESSLLPAVLSTPTL